MIIKKDRFLSGASLAKGISIVIDVFRAFTNSAILLDAEVSNLVLVDNIEIALAAKNKFILVGERNGRKPDGFDFGNSPSDILRNKDAFRGKPVILCTSHGTKGACAAQKNSSQIVLASFLNLSATAAYVKQQIKPDLPITILAMGRDENVIAVEDEACGNLLEQMFLNQEIDYEAALLEIILNPFTQKNLSGQRDHFPGSDVVICLQKDMYNFAMCAKLEKPNILSVSKVKIK